MEITASSNIPKLSLSTLDLKNSYFVVPMNGLLNYFPIKVEEESLAKPIMRFEKCPPVLVDGIVIVGKKFYEVSSEDVARGIIKKFREIDIKRDKHGRSTTSNSSGGSTASSDGTSASPDNQTVSRSDKHGAVGTAGLEIEQAADAAWQDQVESLLGFVSSKEGGEWEVTYVAQP